jgi:DNA-binding HxlR family transcriptional regulator
MGFGDGGELGGEGRAGALTLSLLAKPLNHEILEQLSRGPRRLSELRRLTGSPPQTTLRAYLGQLDDVGIVANRNLNLLPGMREYELTNLPGRELLFVATTLEGWLASAPEGPLDLASEGGRVAIGALAESWSSTMLRALAAGPASPAELESEIRLLSRDSLERRLGALRAAGLIAGHNAEGRHTSYEITDWLRKGTGPIAAAARWERRHLPHATAPIRPIDAEAGFLLAMPLLRPAPELSGSCRLAVEFGDGRERCLAGVTVEVAEGRVASCTTRLESSPVAWATGPAGAWLRTAIEADPNRLELGGDRRLVRGLLDGLNQVLFGPARPLPPRL